jgi:murein DD-endopeptidase MepM/ murein hydrolase activator NlpD
MCNFSGKYLFCAVALLVIGCDRSAPSPVVMKIEERVSSSDFAWHATRTHTVTRNDTLFDVAYKYNIDPMHLAKINGIKPPYKVKPGRRLILPTESAVDEAPSDGTVRVVALENDFSSTAVPEGREIPSYENDYMEEVKGSGEVRKPKAGSEIGGKPKDELDEHFSAFMSSDASTNVSAAGGSADKSHATEKNNGKTASTGTSFNEQAESMLSRPKIIKTAAGEPLIQKDSEKKVEKKIEKKAHDSGDRAPVRPSAGKMLKPVEGTIVSNFGDVKDGVSNDGINLKAPLGAKVKAADGGTVIYAGNKLEEGFGNIVMVQHDNGLITAYAHLKDIKVKSNAVVQAGDVLGTVGKTGDVSEPQLHFEIMKDKKPIDPKKYI